MEKKKSYAEGRGGLVLPDIKGFETSVNNTVLY